ncbi:glycosyltransferase [Acidocella aromatica]|uniref:Glycosyltransferase involved in cell wall biosynthesis n=1 Tax=Acidocella aromatica TaxID=1303579 RepID=A0A840VLU6_9PROT|nr:glycosyltransferase [Acidocella aromatica]MBB5372440.1 glycosyltransferase involved in cell wall biosynthesis [Acidocella aromatica]
MSLVVDLRCLQDVNYRKRGIGQHALSLLRQAPGPVTGIIDPAMPPLPGDMSALVAELSPHAYISGAKLFLNPCPFGPNQAALARLLTAPGVTKAACVYDFIPFDDQATYLADDAARLDYFTALAWLKRYDVLLPISAPTEARQRELFGMRPSVVTGVALPGWIYDIAPQKPRHILTISGNDPRKNPEQLAAAHAASPVLRRLPLVITGWLAPERAARLRSISGVELPGAVSDEAMRSLYAQAYAVVTPSRAEGFSLPVMEACAAGVPSIASDIPAHRALLPIEFLFPLDDPAALAHRLEDVLARREAVVQAQSGLWREFSEEQVAAKVFAALLPKPALARGAKPRIAMLTPMSPEKTGIAAYSAACAAELGKLARLDVFAGNAVSTLPYANGKYDAVLSVIGNSPLHERIYDNSLRWGSAALCHDARLMGLLHPRAAALASAELGRVVTEREIAAWAADESQRAACFLGELAAARPLIFHERHSVALVRERFGVAARYLRFAMQRQFPPMDKQAARAALGIPMAQKLVVSFGFVTRGKGIPAALAALALLKGRVDIKLVFAGEDASQTENFRALARELGIADAVQFGTGFLPEALYRLWLAAADAGLQLREGLPGNISAALQDCIGAGLPSVASADLAENLSAPAYIKRVSDKPDPREIASALEDVLTAPPETEEARLAYCAAHSMAVYAAELLELLLP